MPISTKDFDRIKASLESNRSVFFSTNEVDISFQTHVLKFDRQAILLSNPVGHEYIKAVVNSSQFYVQLQMIRLTSDKIETDGVNIELPLLHLQSLSEARKEERIIYNPDDLAKVEFTNPVDGKTKLSKSIMDLSSTGLSMRVPFHSNLYVPDMACGQMVISIKGKIYNKINGRVKYRKLFFNENRKLFAQVGIQFES